MNVCRSPLNDSEFKQYYQLRWQILRQPWQQPVGSERDDNESTSLHRIILDSSQQVLAVGRVEKVDSNTAQIRYMAVKEGQQGLGLGKQLMQSLEVAAKEYGCNQVMLHARESAESFYLALGYQPQALSHLLYGEIQHIHMIKKLTS